MTDQFADLKSGIDKFELSELHAPEAWQSFFNDCTALLNHSDEQMKDYALERLQKAIWAENSQRYRQPGFSPPTAEQRLQPILAAIAEQGSDTERCLLRFTMWSSLKDDQKNVLSEWLQSSEEKGILSRDVLSIAKIQAELIPTDDWIEAKPFIEPFFDDKNDLLRTAAASAFGQLYDNGASHLPPLAEVMQEVLHREIERPGFAGAFIGRLLMSLNADGEIADSGVKLSDWILEIMAKRKSEEPSVPFYNGIDFHAHELLSNNPAAVRKLMDFGAESVAANAATEENRPIEGMQELLEELANSADYFVSRTCSWHLAYHYKILHPEGHRRGFVQQSERDDVTIFLVFDPETHPETYRERPFAATLYPRELHLNDEVAWKWIDKLIPPEDRPKMEDNDFPYKTPQIIGNSVTYAFGSYFIQFFGDPAKKLWQRVWIKWPRPVTYW